MMKLDRGEDSLLVPSQAAADGIIYPQITKYADLT
jgi:hypothetical protein